jgi:hypothetical protein
MAVAVETSFGQQCDSNGVPMSGALIYVYDAGTTTSRSVYSNTGLSVSAANPIVCDSSGRHDMRYISASAYKIVVKTSAGSTVYTRDNIDPGVPIGSGTLAVANGGTGASDAATALTNLGAATTAQITTLSEEVAELAGAVGSTGSTQLATGTTAQRPSSDLAEGMIRRNTTTHRTEGYNNSAAWENYLTDTEIATQSEQETGTDTTKVVTPGRQHFHPCSAKAWAAVTVSGGTPTLSKGYNVASITDNGAGDFTINFTTALSDALYAAVATVLEAGSDGYAAKISSKATTGVRVVTIDSTGGSLVDNLAFSVLVFGDI